MTYTNEIKFDAKKEIILCRKLLEGTGLTMLRAVQLGIEHRHEATNLSIEEILEQFLINRKTTRSNRTRTIDEYRCQLAKFVADFGHRSIETISAIEIEKWLSAPHLDSKGRKRTWAGSRRNVTRGYIATLFNFGVRKRFCSTNPAAGVDKAIIERSPIKVWTPTETTSILKVAEEFKTDAAAKAADLSNFNQGIYIYRENRLIHGPDCCRLPPQ